MQAVSIGVYPRVCGGTADERIVELMCRGLSPRVRGNRALPQHSGYSQRSIPACAGEPPRLGGSVRID